MSKAHPTRRLLVAAVVGIAALASPLIASGAASAADVPALQDGDQVYIGWDSVGDGGTELQSVYAPVPTDPTAPGTPQFYTYCIEHDEERSFDVTATVGDAASYLGTNYFTDPTAQGKVRWVIAHSYPALSLSAFATAAGAPGLSEDDAIEATQYAVWRYTELTYDASWFWSSGNSETAYWYLVNGANASSGMTAAQLEPTVSVTAPGGAQTAGTLVGPFVVHTDQAAASVTAAPGLAVVDGGGTAVDTSAVTDGEELYLDLSGSTSAGSATLTATVAGSSGMGKVLTLPTTAGQTPTAADHGQSLILVAPSGSTTSASASVRWAGTIAPSISTTLVDSADGDHLLPEAGGALTDTVSYQGLTPGASYTVTGTLMLKPGATSTGLSGTTTFTPTQAAGTVDVPFTVPTGYGGDVLVAFESLTETGSSQVVAAHEDIDDAAQTVTVDPTSAVVTGAVGASVNTGGTVASSTSGDPWLWIALIVGGLMAGTSALVLGRARGRREA